MSANNNEAARRREIAAFLLSEAKAAGVLLGTDGYWLDIVTPRGMPRDVAMWFTRELGRHKDDVVTAIIEAYPTAPDDEEVSS